MPCEPAGNPRSCLAALRALPKAERALLAEVWVARGLNPSRQRNLAAARAAAPWILFLDSDSQAQPGQLPGPVGRAPRPWARTARAVPTCRCWMSLPWGAPWTGC